MEDRCTRVRQHYLKHSEHFADTYNINVLRIHIKTRSFTSVAFPFFPPHGFRLIMTVHCHYLAAA